MAERTFSILKPDATKRNLTGKINAVIEDAGLRIVAQRRIRMTQEEAEDFYDVHRERPFYGELVEFMTSEPVVVQVPRSRQRRRPLPRGDGRDQPGPGRRRHHPQAVRPVGGARTPSTARTAPTTPSIEIAQFFE